MQIDIKKKMLVRLTRPQRVAKRIIQEQSTVIRYLTTQKKKNMHQKRKLNTAEGCRGGGGDIDKKIT